MSATATTTATPANATTMSIKKPVIPIPANMKLTPLPTPLDITSYENPVVQTVPEDSGAPCRKCLKDATPGEEVYLVSYNPFSGTSPYTQPGPVFVHKSPECELAQPTTLPEQQQRLLSVRGFTKQDNMIIADVSEGEQVLGMCEKFFEDEKIEYVNLHYARHGCFAVRVDRA